MVRHVLWMAAATALACAGRQAREAADFKLDPARTPAQQISDALRAGVQPEMIRICEWEAPTGSHLRFMSCRWLDEDEQSRAAAQQLYIHLLRSRTQLDSN